MKAKIVDVLRRLLAHNDRPAVSIDENTSLFSAGLNLDSLMAAQLSVMLEGEFGKDPYSAGLIPVSVGDILRFYEESK